MEAVVWLMWILIAVIGAKVYVVVTHRQCHSRRRLDGKTILITGATSGQILRLSISFSGDPLVPILANFARCTNLNTHETDIPLRNFDSVKYLVITHHPFQNQNLFCSLSRAVEVPGIQLGNVIDDQRALLPIPLNWRHFAVSALHSMHAFPY